MKDKKKDELVEVNIKLNDLNKVNKNGRIYLTPDFESKKEKENIDSDD